jgi:hypothetical protein
MMMITHTFEWLFVLFMPVRTTMAKKLFECVQRLNNYGLQSGHYRQLRACSDPKWPVERVANWLVIPQSASARGQNKAPCTLPGGRRTPLNCFSGYRAMSAICLECILERALKMHILMHICKNKNVHFQNLWCIFLGGRGAKHLPVTPGAKKGL